MRLAFFGTPDFAVAALAALRAAGHDVVRVYTRAPRPAGRGQKLRQSPVHDLADAAGIPVATPKSLRDPQVQADFAALDLDAAVVVAYGLILPPEILTAPRHGCLNIHASLLPRWRGAAPIQRAILGGDAETGVTIMAMDEGLDTGPMLLVETLPITAATTAGMLHDDLAALGARLICQALENLAGGDLKPTPQPADGATYADKITAADAHLDWRNPANHLDRQVRAFAPWPGTWFDHQGKRIKVRAATPVPGQGAPGQVVAPPLTVACGDGALRLETLQREGKAPMAAEAFVRGFPITSLEIPDDGSV